MKNISRYKVEPSILITLIVFMIISITTIFSATTLLNDSYSLLFLKQLFWYGIGFGVAYFIMFIGNDFLYRHAYIFYGIGIFLLCLLFLIGDPINGSISWFSVLGIGNFQPSEFMKIVLIIVLARVIHDFNDIGGEKEVIEEFKFILKVFAIVGLPSILTILQPDTGAVLIYLVIMIAMLFVSGIRYRFFFFMIISLIMMIGLTLLIYFTNQNMFIDIFGTSFFYRVERILEWSNGNGMQLQNALTAMGSGGLFGNGFNNIPIYFPEPHTDFIFAVLASNYGLIGGFLFILLLIFFNTKLINLAVKINNPTNKYVLAGIIGMLIYQQIQNIGMTLGLLPIIGITLPFISYGGSSLLSYMIMIGIIFNISNESLRYTN